MRRTKTVTRHPQKLKTELTDRKTKVDAFITLHQFMQSISDKIKTYETLKKELLDNTPEITDLSSILTLKGTTGDVTFSEGQNATIIYDKNGLIKQLTQKTYNEHSTITLTKLRDLMSGNDLDKFTKIERTEVRCIKEVILKRDNLTEF